MNSYDDEYQQIDELFWEQSPAKYVRLFVEKKFLKLDKASVLDIGAGEGKNAIYLAQQGAFVDAVEISKSALTKLQLLNEFKNIKKRINLICKNALTFMPEKVYDLVICYGLLHALNTRKEVDYLIDKLKGLVKINGYIIIATFNDVLPPPDVQSYLKIEAFLHQNELKNIFSEWEIIKYEEEIITEIHKTSNIEHQHSISRLIAKHV